MPSMPTPDGFANLVLWKKYGGIPSHERAEGVQPI